MLHTLISSMRANASNDTVENRRGAPRRVSDRCVAVIGGRILPVENWSLGGVLLNTDERMFMTDQVIHFTLKFKLRNTILDISHQGRVVRKGKGKVALKFDPPAELVRRCFQQVIDDYVAGEFANSQA